MDATLAINPGSASKKYALYREGKQALSVLFERTADGFGKCVEVGGVRQRCEDASARAYEHALDEFADTAIREGVIVSGADIVRIGIRIVSPGTFFAEHRPVDDHYRAKLASMRDAAPLHIPHEIEELDAAMRLFPEARIVGASDSAFHRSMPEHAHAYSIRKDDAEAYDLHRFGYHGLSTSSVVKRLAGFISALPSRMIVCHIGSGVSVTAVRDGASIDTTMGFGPASGLMMNTRAGDLDPAALFYLMRKKEMDTEAAERYVSGEGGFRGMLGQSDLRIALERRARGEHDAAVALGKYFGGIRKAVGAMGAVLGGIDAVVLTGTVSERNAGVRAELLSGFEYAGVRLDLELNEALMEREGKVSSTESTASIYVIKTDEMREIAEVAEKA